MKQLFVVLGVGLLYIAYAELASFESAVVAALAIITAGVYLPND